MKDTVAFDTTPGVSTPIANEGLAASDPTATAVVRTLVASATMPPDAVRAVTVTALCTCSPEGERASRITSTSAVSDSMSAPAVTIVRVRVTICQLEVRMEVPTAPAIDTSGAASISQSCPAAKCTEIEPPSCTRPTV